jgi:hypothetical protein
MPNPIVGRDRELADLTRHLGLEGEPQSRSLLLAGDAGVGKTRLLAELIDRLTAAGWRTMVGHCLDFADTAPPYLPSPRSSVGWQSATPRRHRSSLRTIVRSHTCSPGAG